MPLIQDPRYTQAALVGPVDQDAFATEQPKERGDSALNVLAAAARQANIGGGAYEFFSTARDPGATPAPPGYDPLDDIAGYEDHAANFVGAKSPAEVASIKQRIADERSDQEVLRRAGIGGTAATLGFGLIDPSFLVAAAVPELGLARGARLAKILTSAAQGATGAASYEAAQHLVQETRTGRESAVNIGAAAVLGGVLGTLLRTVPNGESKALREALRKELNGEIGSTVGAAASGPATTAAQEMLARGGGIVNKASGFIPFQRTDLQTVLASKSVEARRVLQELADVSPVMQKNVEGIASPHSVENLVGGHEGGVADFVDFLHDAWARYRERTAGVTRMSEADFRAGVASAARRSDTSVEPEIAEAAKYLRSRVFDPLKDEATQLKLLPPNAEVVGAESYFRRMYDREAIRNGRREWDSVLTTHFMKKGVEYAEARSAAEDVTRRILGQDIGQANFNVRTHMPSAGPLHERVLDIPDERIEKFLVNDPVKVAQSYMRAMAPEIELTKRFGDKDMSAALQRVKDEYDVLRERVRSGTEGDTSKPLSALSDNEKASLEALTRIRDRITGRAGRLSPDASTGARKAVEISRGWRNITAAAKLGGAALPNAAQDAGRIVAQYGFLPTIAKIARLAVSPEFRALSKAQARRLGAAVDVTLSRRVNVAYDGAATEGWTQALANGVYKYSGLNHWTDFGRTLSVTMLEDKVLKTAAKVAEGGEVTGWSRGRLAALGLDHDTLKAIAKEVEKHGEVVDGVHTSGSANWDDAALSKRYDGALLKEARQTVMQPGAADKTWWMDSETGKVLGQLKSFALAAPTRFAMVPAQMIGQGNVMGAARFLGMMMAGGALAHILRSYAAGKQPKTDPQGLAFEAFNESGLSGAIPDVVSPLGRRFGILGESARYSDRNVASALGGPAVGALADAYDLAFNRTAGGISASDLHALRRLLPYQNLWYLRRAINALEGEGAEGMALKGSDYKTFGQRFAETTPLEPAGKRGGGMVAQIN